MQKYPRKSIITIIIVSAIFILILGGCAQPAAEPTQVPKQPEPVKEEPTTVPTDPPEPTPTQVPPTEIPTEEPPTETPTPDFTPTPEIQYSDLQLTPNGLSSRQRMAKTWLAIIILQCMRTPRWSF